MHYLFSFLKLEGGAVKCLPILRLTWKITHNMHVTANEDYVSCVQWFWYPPSSNFLEQSLSWNFRVFLASEELRSSDKWRLSMRLRPRKSVSQNTRSTHVAQTLAWDVEFFKEDSGMSRCLAEEIGVLHKTTSKVVRKDKRQSITPWEPRIRELLALQNAVRNCRDVAFSSMRKNDLDQKVNRICRSPGRSVILKTVLHHVFEFGVRLITDR